MLSTFLSGCLWGRWLEDVYPHLHAVVDHGGAGVRNSLFGSNFASKLLGLSSLLVICGPFPDRLLVVTVLSSGAGVPYLQHWVSTQTLWKKQLKTTTEKHNVSELRLQHSDRLRVPTAPRCGEREL